MNKYLAIYLFIVLLIIALAGCTSNRLTFSKGCAPVTHECDEDGCDYEVHCP